MKDWKRHAHRVLNAVQPVTRAAERVGSLLVHMQAGISPMGAVSLASAAMNSANEWLTKSNAHAPAASWSFHLWLPAAEIVTACVSAGAVVVKRYQHGEHESTAMSLHGTPFTVMAKGGIQGAPDGWGPFAAWLKQALDAHMPRAVRVTMQEGNLIALPCNVRHFETDIGAQIVSDQSPLMGTEGRVILLDGEPGVGKSTLAHEIGARMGGRTVVFAPGTVVSTPERESASDASNEGARYLSPSTVIVDDVDKLHLHLGELEQLRQLAPLVILTANNAHVDSVLDRALIRPARVDEIYTITCGEERPPEEPFDQLDRETWARVRNWPHAWLNEVARRIRARGTEPHRLRLDELAERLERKTRSGVYLG